MDEQKVTRGEQFQLFRECVVRPFLDKISHIRPSEYDSYYWQLMKRYFYVLDKWESYVDDGVVGNISASKTRLEWAKEKLRNAEVKLAEAEKELPRAEKIVEKRKAEKLARKTLDDKAKTIKDLLEEKGLAYEDREVREASVAIDKAKESVLAAKETVARAEEDVKRVKRMRAQTPAKESPTAASSARRTLKKS